MSQVPRTPEEAFEEYEIYKKQQDFIKKTERIKKQCEIEEERIKEETEQKKLRDRNNNYYNNRSDYINSFDPSGFMFNTTFNKIENCGDTQYELLYHISKCGNADITVVNGGMVGSCGFFITSGIIDMKIFNPVLNLSFNDRKITNQDIVEHFYDNGNMYRKITKGPFKDYTLESSTPLSLGFIFLFPIFNRGLKIKLCAPRAWYDPIAFFRYLFFYYRKN